MVEEISDLPAYKPVHPGALLRATIIPASGLSKAALATHLGLSRQSLYQILNEVRPISPDIAARVGKAFGNSCLFWLNMQAAHDAWIAERSVEIASIGPISPSA